MSDEVRDLVVNSIVEEKEVVGREICRRSVSRVATGPRGQGNEPRWQTTTSSRSCAAARCRTSSEALFKIQYMLGSGNRELDQTYADVP